MGRTSSSDAACNAWSAAECTGTPHCPPRCPRFTDAEGNALLVRPYRSAHLRDLVAMYDDLDGYSRTLGLPPATASQIEDWLTHLVSDGWNLVATAGGRVVGHLAVVPADAAVPKFVVFVHQDYQNRGIGTELVKQAVARADDMDYDGIKGYVSAGNRRALRVYENVGFDVADRLDAESRIELSMAHPVVDRVQRPPAERGE